jgi:hypothetical protein
MKKTNWIVSIELSEFKRVCLELKKLKCEIYSELDTIGVVLIKASVSEVTVLKKMKGILAVEPEREVSI